MTVSDRLRKVRGSLGKSQKEMAAALKLSYSTYQNYEDGRNNPGWDTCEVLTRMGFNPTWLLTGEGEMRRGTINGHIANGHNNIQGAHIGAEALHLTVLQPGAAADPGLKYMDSRQNQWFHDWIDEVLKGKTISEIMSIAVKFKQLLDLDKEG